MMFGNEDPQLRATDMDSFIEIELYQENAYKCGQPLYGTVHLYAKETIKNVKQVSLTLNGEEQAILHLPDKTSGGAMKPVNKIHPIVNQRFVLFDYSQYKNMIVEGQYSFPFTLNLPEWLPQSVLCFNTPDPKKPMLLNTFKIRYNLIAVIEGIKEEDQPEAQPEAGTEEVYEKPDKKKNKEVRRTTIIQTEKQGVTMTESQNMVHVRRITVITPEYSQPLLN